MIAKDSQIVEVLEDGTFHAFDLDVCDREAERVLRNLQKKEGKLFNYDYGMTVFTLFVYCVHILREAGWETQELIDEVIDHTQQYDDRDSDLDDKEDSE
jgi:hypothetical protein